MIIETWQAMPKLLYACIILDYSLYISQISPYMFVRYAYDHIPLYKKYIYIYKFFLPSNPLFSAKTQVSTVRYLLITNPLFPYVK